MGARVCGAMEERDKLSASRCWCRGLFCGPGGYKRSAEFRKAFHTAAPAPNAAEFEERVAQADLFDGNQLATKWRARLDAHAPRAAATRKRSAAVVDSQDGVSHG